MKKKFILLPITLTALAPAISLVGCGDPKDPEVTKYAFEFTGNHCKINGHDKLSVDIEENTKVEYTVLPDDGYELLETQDLPEGVTLVGNLLTIEKMDKAYAVTINAEVSESPLIIQGLEQTYQGTVGQEGHSTKITVYLVVDGQKYDMTDNVTFDLSNDKLVWDAENKWFSWSNEINSGDYSSLITASLFDTIVSDTYTSVLKINPRTPYLTYTGIPTDPVEVASLGYGEISPVSFFFHSADIVTPTDVTKQVVVMSKSENFIEWDASGDNGKFYWNEIDTEPHYIAITVEYSNVPFVWPVDIRFGFWIIYSPEK